MNEERQRFGTLTLGGSYNWKIIAEFCLSLEERGFTTFFNWGDGKLIIEIVKQKPMLSNSEIKSSLCTKFCHIDHEKVKAEKAK